MSSIRGAITVEKNDKKSMLEATEMLLKAMLKENKVNIDDITSILFTATKDLTAVYPAVAARALGITQASLMCMQELNIDGSLPMCIRTMMTVDDNRKQSQVTNVYLKDAVKLRPDIAMKKKGFAITIDGPSGTGKSTAARAIAAELGFIYVDSGAMYRAVGLYCLENNINLNDEKEIGAVLDNIDISITYKNGKQIIYLNGENCTTKIRTQEIASAASAVAKIGVVREKLVAMQRRMSESKKIVMDGRDIGTHVLPDAQVKFYIDAKSDERAIRRCHELEEKGEKADFQKIKEEIEKRDFEDKNRKLSPLKKAKDAIEIDTTSLNAEQVSSLMVRIIKEKI